MKNETLDEAIVEACRFIKAAKALRAATGGYVKATPSERSRLKASAERAALDCRYKLADLRQGR